MLTVCFQTCAPIDDGWKPASPPFQTDPVFYPYINDFEYYARIDASFIPIRMNKLQPGTAGMCHKLHIGDVIVAVYIEINKSTWENITELQKNNLIFHELGHCALNRGHTSLNNYVDMCPSSFMHEAILSDYCLQENYQKYLDEMFPGWRANEI